MAQGSNASTNHKKSVAVADKEADTDGSLG